MKQTGTCLTDDLLLQLADRTLSPEELAEVEVHITGCGTCRDLLEGTTVDGDLMSDMRAALSNPGRTDPVSESDIDQFGWTTQDVSQPLEQVIGLLAPTDDPRMLGRLGVYEIVGVLGRGGMGLVLKGFDAALNRYVAIKLLAPHLAASGTARKRFEREARAAAAVVDDHVMAIHGVAEWQGVPYLVMPYVRGVSLQRRLDEQGPLDLREILRIGMQTASGLAAAHAQGLVHRDVKPANILLADGVERVTLTDFGLARAVDDASLTRTGVLAGTPQYMSPEQSRGRSVDARSDLFSLGSVMYALCVGWPPFRADSSYGILRMINDEEPRPIRELNPDIPAWLCTVISRLMEKLPENRFASAQEVSELLAACLAHVQQPDTAPLPQIVAGATKQRSGVPQHSNNHRLLTVVVVAGLVFLGMFGWQATNPPDIRGEWSGEGWGKVVLQRTNDYTVEYSGTYDTHGDKPGSIRLKWSRIERQFNGTWNEGEDRLGDLSIRLSGDEILGAQTTDVRSKINPATPRLTSFKWIRPPATKVGAQLPVRDPNDRRTVHLQFSSEDSPPLTEVRVDLARVGYSEHVRQLPSWTTDKNLRLQIEKLPYESHYLVAMAGWPNGSVSRVKIPPDPQDREWKLTRIPAWVTHPELRAPVITASATPGEDDLEAISITVANQTQEPHTVTVWDLELSNSELRVIPNVDAKQLDPNIVLAPGQSRIFTLKWADLVREGLWVSRRKPDAEPAKELPAETKISLRARGCQPVALTAPQEVLRRSFPKAGWFRPDPYPQIGMVTPNVEYGSHRVFIELAQLADSARETGIAPAQQSAIANIHKAAQARLPKPNRWSSAIDLENSENWEEKKQIWFEARQEVETLLQPVQRKRVEQLLYQKMGFKAFLYDEVQTALHLTDQQIDRIKVGLREHYERLQEYDAELGWQKLASATSDKKTLSGLEKLRVQHGIVSHKHYWDVIYLILTPEQRAAFEALRGPAVAEHSTNVPAAAPSSPTPGESPIVAIKVEGNATIPSASILKLIKSRRGHPVDPQALRDDVRVLYNTGWFTEVLPTYRQTEAGMALVLRVVEHPDRKGPEARPGQLTIAEVAPSDVNRRHHREFEVRVPARVLVDWVVVERRGTRESIIAETRGHAVSDDRPWTGTWTFAMGHAAATNFDALENEPLQPDQKRDQWLNIKLQFEHSESAERTLLQTQSVWFQAQLQDEWRQVDYSPSITRRYIVPFLTATDASWAVGLEEIRQIPLFFDKLGESEGPNNRALSLRISSRKLPDDVQQTNGLHVYPGASWNVLLRQPRPASELGDTVVVLKTTADGTVSREGVLFDARQVVDLILDQDGVSEQSALEASSRLAESTGLRVWRRQNGLIAPVKRQ